ncbi:hypothetical protein QN277_016045 [Acacia crassicarpa]|uniref:Uncharacterized protein n=1 Tax=Acacia crassicarpa TaxID=499986 RepID=A0AAE1MVT4_9FABA|nr:hypothetical protein QN277_016045 [Acacia crassicarpa]
MIYCLQNFPLGPLQAHTVEDAIHFWDDTKVKRRVQIERDSNQGLLRPYGDGVGQSSTKLHAETVFTHPEIQRIYDRVMSRVMSTVKSIVQEELLPLQAMLLNDAEIDESDDNYDLQSEDEEPRSQNEQDGGDIQKEDEGSEDIQSTNEDEGSRDNNDSSEHEVSLVLVRKLVCNAKFV